MTATAAQIAQVRRMVGELTTQTYLDADIQAYIERYPLVDAAGVSPWTGDSIPPATPDNANWTPTYDLNAAAADIWDEKAAALAGDYDFSADGGQYSRSQGYQQAAAQARHFRARRSVRTVTMRPEPAPISEDDSNAD